MAQDSELSEDQSRAVAARVREALARRRVSRQPLAADARISLSTLEKALAGNRPFTLSTLVRLEEALGERLRPTPQSETARAPVTLGAYSHAAVAWIEGDYVTLRPSFETPGAIYAYLTSIVWDERTSHLLFREADRVDAAFAQHGEVSLPNQSGHIYLSTNDRGQHRLITLGRPTIDGLMFGLLSTLQSRGGGHLTPVAAPIVLAPLRPAGARFGVIQAGEEGFAPAKGLLDRVLSEAFARMITL
jgi:transcriptional regulator with XRE-family HTH domain